ncbi:Protein HYPER-SENSITIVITY-RELATED 4 [Camellia lanceoleosa]|uniref:Protein HYPER-SENSITIVITY-RELATED 4 n=1 Tax=Camellia lanceoleosa TaxID=1840588 RepID=A0ACC0IRC3_9ERIC|nr:Protein HYPER-SENSITIVITY-RELATED 4 [Camellia lanceoleosa]
MGGVLGNFSSQRILVIDETNGLSFNKMFEASEIYLRLKISPSVEWFKVSKAPGEKDLCVSINQGEKIVDTFESVHLTWQMICIETQKTSTNYEGGFETNMVERRSIELYFHKKYREMELDESSKGFVCFITSHEFFCNLRSGYLHLCHELLNFSKHGVIFYAKVLRSKELKATGSAVGHVDVHVHATWSQ